MIVAVGLGLWVARKGNDTAQSYFLGKTIPWFFVGASMVAADLSSEQFISNVSGAYKYGIVLYRSASSQKRIGERPSSGAATYVGRRSGNVLRPLLLSRLLRPMTGALRPSSDER